MAKNVLRKTVSRTRGYIKKETSNARKGFEDIEDSTVKYIKKNPVKSAAIALGAGALIGVGLYMGIESAIRARMRRQSFWQKYNPFNI